MHPPATSPKYGATQYPRMSDQCLMKSCDHPRAGPGGGRLDAGLANFCLCHGRELLAAFPLPSDDAADPLGQCTDA